MNKLESKVKSVIDGTDHTTRQQRRQLKRSANKYDKRVHFTKDEVTAANEASYEYGKQLALKAATEVIGLGPKRLERIAEAIAKLEFETFVKPFEGEKK